MFKCLTNTPKNRRFGFKDTFLCPRLLWSLKFLIVTISLATLVSVWLLQCCETITSSKTSLPVTKIIFHELHISIGSQILFGLLGRERRENLIGSVGRTVSGTDYRIVTKTEADLLVDFPSGIRLTVRHNRTRTVGEPSCYDILWDCYKCSQDRLQDTFSLKDARWYGGAVVKAPLWPTDRLQRSPDPFVTGDSYNDYYGGVQERFWLSSNGVSLFVDYDVPLFVGLNESGDGMLNFVSSFSKPYGNSRNRNLFLSYAICQAENITAMYLGAVGRFWKKPFDIPDKRAFRYPIWSTWAAFKKHIDAKKVIDFARKINEEGFNNSHLEIDDGWAEKHGDLIFDFVKFPDPVEMVSSLKDELGFRVTLWVHPFASLFSSAIWERDSKGNRLWMKLRRFDFPAFMIWWNGLGAVLDLTNAEAAGWFQNSLKQLAKEYRIDSFKFDGGEAGWLSSWGVGTSPLDNLNDYTKAFIDVAYKSDTDLRLQEVRVGVSSQHLPIFIRLMDKDSIWDYSNGLRSIIPHILLFGVIGYPFVLPDMIGGNAYNFLNIHSTTWPERELYVRWMELTALLPAMQFSVVPWLYDDEVVRIAHKMCDLHERYADKIIALAEEATRTGAPIIRALWWIAPLDEEALRIDTEFLVGDDLLVAPVVEEGATARDIYLPAGNWKDELNGGAVLEGERWYRDYRVLLDELAYFTLIL